MALPLEKCEQTTRLPASTFFIEAPHRIVAISPVPDLMAVLEQSLEAVRDHSDAVAARQATAIARPPNCSLARRATNAGRSSGRKWPASGIRSTAIRGA